MSLTDNVSTTALTGHIDQTDSDPITSMDLGAMARMTVSVFDETGGVLEESRLYFDIPDSGSGTEGTDYDATFIGYDDQGRRVRIKAPQDTITLPIQPTWPGFAINTLFYAAVVWSLIFGSFALRRLIRRKRGLCVACGYDLRGCQKPGCPECGWRREAAS